MSFTKYIRVGIAEAEHLLHSAHSPREVVLGLTEDVLQALLTGQLPSISPPPASSTAPVAAPAPTTDPRVDALQSTVGTLQAQTSQIIAMLTKLTSAPAPVAAPVPVPTPVTPAPVTTAPAALPVPVAAVPAPAPVQVFEPSATPATPPVPAFLPKPPTTP